MSKTSLYGSIYEIPLECKYGFGYCKVLKSKSFGLNSNIPDIVQLYKFTSISPVKSISDITDRELLVAPIGITGSNGISKSNWRLLGTEEIKETERFLPHVKAKWPPLISNPDKWVYFEDLGDTMKMHYSDIESVNHLEFSRILHFSIIPFKVSMEKSKLLGEDIKSIWPPLSDLEELEFNNSNSIPPYSLLPKNLQGRAKK